METAKEIPQEIKAKMFALYWGQDVVKSGRAEDDRTYNVQGANIEDIFSNGESVLDKSYLELKPLSQITDEDAIECGFTTCTDENSANYSMSPSGCFVDYLHNDNIFNVLDLFGIDFLRSRGYALPAFGHSVSDLVGHGVFKIVEP